MYVVKARNVHCALPEALYQIKTHGVKRESRNGPVLKFPEPCSIVYEKPCERVVFWPERDANPTFHLLESLWMLAGRNDVKFVGDLVARMATYSDDGETFNGAYGYRWRQHFKIDQVLTISAALKKNPDCRRQVLAMWDGHHDLGLQSKDLPCNTHTYFSVNDGKLDMMVCNRSNDLVWGALGANAVHFSVLQEVMAALIGVGVGRYWQTSNNMHLYLDQHAKLMEELSAVSFPDNSPCPYELGEVKAQPIVDLPDPAAWLKEVTDFVDLGLAMGIKSKFLRKVVIPLAQGYSFFKGGEGLGRFTQAQKKVDECGASDWARACEEWYTRREMKARAKLEKENKHVPD